MKISITTSELNEMINLVLKPERMNSMFDLRKNIQTYANIVCTTKYYIIHNAIKK